MPGETREAAGESAPAKREFTDEIIECLVNREGVNAGDSESRLAEQSLAAMPCAIDFDEGTYLSENPDVKGHVDLGLLETGKHHYLLSGAREGRKPAADATELEFQAEQAAFSISGFLFLNGWISDEHVNVEGLRVRIGYVNVSVQRSAVVRYRRPDVEEHFHGEPHDYDYGFLVLVRLPWRLTAVKTVEVLLSNGGYSSSIISAGVVSEEHLLERVLGLLVDRAASPLAISHTLADLQTIFGRTIEELWQVVLESNASFHEEQIGTAPGNPSLTVVTVLYGRSDCIPLQTALLHRHLPAGADVELIYANNSPQLRESVLRETELAYDVYGHPIRVIDFAGNTGFGHACNQCAVLARGRTLLFLNPDVFACSPDWYERVTEAASMADGSMTILSGVLLYADGSVMHDGMDVVVDRLPAKPGSAGRRRILRVDHYAKGSPLWALNNHKLRRVPAVTGATMLVSRETFDRLGGFSRRYLFGHYEDADLSLRTWDAGGTVQVMRDLRLFHYEGKGSVLRPFHRGAALVNRCRFTETWLDRLDHIRAHVAAGVGAPGESNSSR